MTFSFLMMIIYRDSPVQGESVSCHSEAAMLKSTSRRVDKLTEVPSCEMAQDLQLHLDSTLQDPRMHTL